MGYTGAFVALHVDEPLAILTEAAGEVEKDDPHVWSPGSGWHVVQLSGSDLYERFDESWMVDLAARTGAPVLVFTVMHSDYGELRGFSQSGFWSGWIDPFSAVDALAGARETVYHDTQNGGGDYDEDYPMDHRQEWAEDALQEYQRRGPDLAAAVVRWAADTGRVVPVDPVAELMTASVDVFAESQFFELLIRLHLDQPTPVG
jgi:hypothetical protein